MRRLFTVIMFALTACPAGSPAPSHHRFGAVGGVGGIGSDLPWSLVQPALLGPTPSGTANGPNSTGGMPLAGVMGFRVSVQAPAGCVLAGTGQVNAWAYSPALASWGRNPDLDLTLSPITLTSCQSGTDAGSGNVSWCTTATFPDLEPGNPGGRVYYQASSVGLNQNFDGGSACTGTGAATGSCDAGCTVTVAVDARVN